MTFYFNILIYDMKDFIDFLFDMLFSLVYFSEYKSKHYIYVFASIYLNIHL